MKLLRDLFAEADNSTWDLGRILGAIAFTQYLGYGLNAYVIHNQVFDPVSAGTGLAAMMAGFGAMILMKGKEQASTTTEKTNMTITPTTIQKTTETKSGPEKGAQG